MLFPSDYVPSEPSATRFSILSSISATLPPQHSDEWYRVRMTSANSSEYGKYDPTPDSYSFTHSRISSEESQGSQGRETSHIGTQSETKLVREVSEFRRRTLVDAAELYRVQGRSTATIATSFGNTFEDASGYLFSRITGLDYYPIGSMAHPSNPRIRGSLDGYGIDGDGKLFVLETKSHYSLDPSSRITNLDYLRQVIQNIEIANADYAFYNATRLLPCPTDCLYDERECYDMRGSPHLARFRRFNLAEGDETRVVALELRPNTLNPTSPLPPPLLDISEWMGNPFDALDRSHPLITHSLLETIIREFHFSWDPFAATALSGAELCASGWVDEVTTRARMDGCLGCAFMKVDLHNIQRIGRQRAYWEKRMRPMAEAWVHDLDLYLSQGEYADSRATLDPPEWPTDLSGH
jgi:hypothetical protein